MHLRHPDNPNLKLHYEPLWNGLPVQVKRGPLVSQYLKRIREVLNCAMREYARVCAIRFDLHFPVGWPQMDTAVITRFIKSLIAQLEADMNRRRVAGKRVHPCSLRYVWVKEKVTSAHCHYHVCILLNRDAYFTLGNYRDAVASGEQFSGEEGLERSAINMAERLNIAWASALHCSLAQVRGLIEYTDTPIHYIDRNSLYGHSQQAALFERLSYFAKVETKHYGTGANNFGCSRG